MVRMLKRHEIQVLRRAGHSQVEVARLAGVSERTVRTVEAEPEVADVDDNAARRVRRIGRPSKAEPFRSFVLEQFKDQPDILSLEILRRARLQGYGGGKSALYDLIASVRSKVSVRPSHVYPRSRMSDPPSTPWVASRRLHDGRKHGAPDGAAAVLA